MTKSQVANLGFRKSIVALLMAISTTAYAEQATSCSNIVVYENNLTAAQSRYEELAARYKKYPQYADLYNKSIETVNDLTSKLALVIESCPSDQVVQDKADAKLEANRLEKIRLAEVAEQQSEQRVKDWIKSHGGKPLSSQCIKYFDAFKRPSFHRVYNATDSEWESSLANMKELCEQSTRPGVRFGMTAKQVVEQTNWGKPNSINRSGSKYGTREQWVYGDGSYLYFENGRLTSYQD